QKQCWRRGTARAAPAVLRVSSIERVETYLTCVDARTLIGANATAPSPHRRRVEDAAPLPKRVDTAVHAQRARCSDVEVEHLAVVANGRDDVAKPIFLQAQPFTAYVSAIDQPFGVSARSRGALGSFLVQP